MIYFIGLLFISNKQTKLIKSTGCKLNTCISWLYKSRILLKLNSLHLILDNIAGELNGNGNGYGYGSNLPLPSIGIVASFDEISEVISELYQE